MRILDADLDAALDSARFTPYLQLQYAIGDDYEWTDAPYPLVSYHLTGCQLSVVTYGEHPDEWFAIRLKRGVVIGGVPNYVTSSHYYRE